MKCTNMELITLLGNDGSRKNVWVDLNKVKSIRIDLIDKNQFMRVEKLNGDIEEYGFEDKITFEKSNGFYYIFLLEKNINLIDVFNIECSSLDLLQEICKEAS